MLPEPRYIGVAGIIGAGKSTLANDLAARIKGARAMHEPVDDNPYLVDFYKDRQKYAFAMQVFLLQARYQQHLQAITTDHTVVQDRTIYEDTVFAQMQHEAGCIDDRDYETYLLLFRRFSLLLQQPDVILYLYVAPEVALERTVRRNRSAERGGVSFDYLKLLHDGYERWYDQTRDYLKVVRVDWNEFLPTEELLSLIEAEVSVSRRFVRRWGRHVA